MQCDSLGCGRPYIVLPLSGHAGSRACSGPGQALYMHAATDQDAAGLTQDKHYSLLLCFCVRFALCA